MEKTEKFKITTATQFEKLVKELQKNPSLAVGFRRGNLPSNFKEQWLEIAKVLNSLGPPIRLGDKWQKVRQDLKFKVKKKMVANKAECHATSGGIFKQFIFSTLEEAEAKLLQLNMSNFCFRSFGSNMRFCFFVFTSSLESEFNS